MVKINLKLHVIEVT